MGRRSMIKKFAAYGEVDRCVEAGDNYAQILGAPHAQTQSAAAEVSVLAVALPVKYSGIFAVRWGAGFASGTAARTVQHKLVVIPVTEPAVAAFTNGTGNGTIYGNDVGVTPDTFTSRSKFGQRLSVDAAGVSNNGIQYNGGPSISTAFGAQTLADTTPTPTVAGLLSGSAMTFGGDIDFGQSFGPKTPYVRSTIDTPQFVIASLVLDSTAAGDVVTYAYAFLGLVELPLS